MMKKEISAGGLVYNPERKKVLLIKDSYGRWALPKGLIEKGESVKQAALREVSEETGINIKRLKIKKKLGTIKYIYTLKGEKIFKIVTFFLIETSAVKLRPQWEVQDARWFTFDEAINKIGYSNTRELLKKFFNPY